MSDLWDKRNHSIVTVIRQDDGSGSVRAVVDLNFEDGSHQAYTLGAERVDEFDCFVRALRAFPELSVMQCAEIAGLAFQGGRRLDRLLAFYESGSPKFRQFVNKDQFIDSYEWKRVRMVAIEKGAGKCACCGATAKDGRKMVVDHIKPRSRYPELALTPSNLQVLCDVCNCGKGAIFETDWRSDDGPSA